MMQETGGPIKEVAKLPDVPYYDIHRWADYVELHCLLNPDGEISKADLLDLIPERTKDLGEGEDTPSVDSPPIETDKWDARVDDWFRHLSSRVSFFQDFYPFDLARREVLVRHPNFTLSQKLYTALLLASNLGRLTPKANSSLTRSFEILSAEVIRACLPVQAEVHVFGTSASSETHYTGSLWTKIETLAQDLHEQIVIPFEKFSPHDSGDNGLDVVAWVPFAPDDTNTSQLVCFGQCACTEEWVTKQHSSQASSWRSVMTFCNDPASFVFIPFHFRATDGSWHRPQDIHGTILIDRWRFLHLFRDRVGLFQQQAAYEVVENAVKQQIGPFD